MIEIYMLGGIYYTTEMKFNTLLNILQDDFIKDNTFIEIVATDECKAAIKKGNIVSINEVLEITN